MPKNTDIAARPAKNKSKPKNKAPLLEVKSHSAWASYDDKGNLAGVFLTRSSARAAKAGAVKKVDLTPV